MNEINGYIALVIGGKPPFYRMVFWNSLQDHKKIFSDLKKEAEGLHRRIEVFRMVNGDTQIIENDIIIDTINE